MLETYIDELKKSLIKECISISYGSIASCIGRNKYSEIDSFIESWIIWIQESPIIFNNWKEAIISYMQDNNF